MVVLQCRERATFFFPVAANNKSKSGMAKQPVPRGDQSSRLSLLLGLLFLAAAAAAFAAADDEVQAAAAASPPRVFRPGHAWLDTNGNPINAHGGGIIYGTREVMT